MVEVSGAGFRCPACQECPARVRVKTRPCCVQGGAETNLAEDSLLLTYNVDGRKAVTRVLACWGTGSIRVEIYSKRSHERVSPMLSMHGDVGLEEAKHAI
jgi:hypothetical protein